MDLYALVKTVHVISSTILFGTGMGIAFFMFVGQRSPDMATRQMVARWTVLADYIFTLPAVLIQPLTGFWLISLMAYDPFEPWLVTTYILYAVAGACWLPVVGLQIRIKRLLAAHLETGVPLPPAYARALKGWFILGWPAFLGLIAVFYLMVAKPVW